SGFYCADGTCLPKKDAGQFCGAAGECKTGFCVDQVCCENACAGKCQSCARALTGKAGGMCAPVMAGTDPDSECNAAAPQTCGQDGECDGRGACRKFGSETICQAETCSASSYSPPGRCDGQGQCLGSGTVSCGNYTCGGSKCQTICNGSADCVNGFYCA